MQIKIPVPLPLRRLSRRFFDWANIPIWRDFRRIDVMIGIGGIPCIGWYAYTGGWLGALAGTLLYTLLVMCSLWFF